MPTLWILIVALVAAAFGAYLVGRRGALEAGGVAPGVLHSLPGYHGAYLALWCCVPPLAFAALWAAFASRILAVLAGAGASEPTAQLVWELGAWGGAALSLGAGFAHARSRGGAAHAARDAVERFVRLVLMGCSTIAILTTIGIVLSLVFEAARFFALVSPFEFFFGLTWSPQLALRPDQVGSSGAFGAIPVFLGTFMIMLIAMGVAVPIGLMSAIYLAEYAGHRTRSVLKPALEVLAGIPTVVYGFFAALSIGPAIRSFGDALGLEVASESAIAAGSVMGVMIIPFVSSLSDDVIRSVPVSLRDAGLALGATRSETIRQVLLPAALPGIAGAILLAISRAIGETMIVVMAAGLSARLTANPFEAVTTVTVQIVSLLVGDQEFDSAKTLAAFALGLVLFTVTLVLNVIALHIVRKYREKYD
jgi:phosphate transport system permease protein